MQSVIREEESRILRMDEVGGFVCGNGIDAINDDGFVKACVGCCIERESVHVM